MADLLEFPEAPRHPRDGKAKDWDPWESPVAGPKTSVGDLFPDAPAEWLDWPAQMELAFHLLEGQGVSQALFDEYTVDTVEEAVAHVYSDAGSCIFFHYRLCTRDVIPLFSWDISRGIHSRGRQGGAFSPREEVEGATPWDLEPNRILLEIYCKPLSYFNSTRMLRVGGPRRADALATWHRCAEPIRRMAGL